MLIGYVSVPLRFQNAASGLATVIFIASPIFALYYAGRYAWNSKTAGIFIGAGLAIQFGIGYAIGQKLLGGHGFFAAVCTAIGMQCGFTMWCVGLGAFLASILRDRNLLIPVSIFLIGFDIYLVLTPLGGTHLALKSSVREVFKTVAYSVPAPTASPTQGAVKELAYMGPADFLFMGMFFIALFKFNLRTRQTLYWLIAAVLVAIGLAFGFGSAVPMMVPIGLAVLLVNLPEFKMNKEEIASTVVVLAIVLAIIGSSFLLGRRVGPSKPDVVQVSVAPAASPAPAKPNPRP